MRYLNNELTHDEALRDGGAHCLECGWNIMRSDDEALICTDCGGLNRLIYKRRWSFGIFWAFAALTATILWLAASYV